MPVSSPARVVHTEVPGPRARERIALGAFDLQHGYRTVVVDDEKSQGVSLADVDGNVFLDLFSSFALGALGYNHPALVEVARSDEFLRASINPTSTPFLTTDTWLRFMAELKEKWAPRGTERVFCVDGGGEGIESAIKLAFMAHATRRRVAAGGPADPLQLSAEAQERILDNEGTDSVLIAFRGAFHGRSLGALSATHSKITHKADVPAFRWPMATFPANRWPLERHADENAAAEAASLAEVARIFEQHDGRVASVLVEPVQSEGGDRHASGAYFRGLQALCKRHGAALILDEVQTGVAITGTMWLHEQFDLPGPPDLVAFGKKMQMGGCFATAPYVVTQFGRMYQTRNGDRARAMLATATLRTIDAEGLCAHAAREGAYFLAGLQEIADRHPALVSDARGRGFLLAFDLPTPASRDDFLKRCLKRGIFASYTGSKSVRIRPHLVTQRADIDEALGVFAAVAKEMA
ncbi:MAG: aminotransferase class III-fold pyridoxal phosphate-dependent enzyme [Deltaproteobacteria bacterium]|nr:aminotransferase class III-fold pyridoxal phosphate-dependent enzyme [Deltaproteobacteria bacterium]